MTAVFKVRQAAIFGAALEGMLAAHARAHGGAVKTSITYGATGIAVVTSPDGALRQHRASVNGLEIISNSLQAMKRVLDTLAGKHARLGDEKDFRYMLARDASEHQPALLFFGDRFVAEVIGPRQKVLEARRQMATAELMTPGFAALLHGWLYGKSPGSVDELVASKLLRKDELKHTAGTAIEWRPGEPARSTWGTPSALTPLIELPSPDTVTESACRVRALQPHVRNVLVAVHRSRGVAARHDRPESGHDHGRAPRFASHRRNGLADILELAGQSPREGAARRGRCSGGRRHRPEREAQARAFGTRDGALGRHAFKLDFLGRLGDGQLADRPRIADVAQSCEPEIPQKPEAEPTETRRRRGRGCTNSGVCSGRGP